MTGHIVISLTHNGINAIGALQQKGQALIIGCNVLLVKPNRQRMGRLVEMG